MATESIFNNIVISDLEAAEKFIIAVEKAALAAEKSIHYNINSRDMTKDDIKKYFGVKESNHADYSNESS